jgi:hypothetical protein
MAEAYKSQGTKLTTTSNTTIYSGVVGTGVVNGVNISNVDLYNSCGINVFLLKGATAFSLISNVIIPVGSSLQVLDAPIICESGNTITATAANGSILEVVVSVLEIT